MFWGVWHAITQMQMHKYTVHTNTTNDEISLNPMKYYIFGEPSSKDVGNDKVTICLL